MDGPIQAYYLSLCHNTLTCSDNRQHAYEIFYRILNIIILSDLHKMVDSYKVSKAVESTFPILKLYKSRLVKGRRVG